MRARVLALLLFALALPALAAEAPASTNAPTAPTERASLHCDGTNEELFNSLHKGEADRVGYGETWDEHVCDEGTDTYAAGATSRWAALRSPRHFQATPEDQFLALVGPVVVLGGIGVMLFGAFMVALVGRLRRAAVISVACPACAAELPITVDKSGEQGMFCPMCGAGCTVRVYGRGKTATASAQPI
jgi:hypothetical protein